MMTGGLLAISKDPLSMSLAIFIGRQSLKGLIRTFNGTVIFPALKMM